MSLFTELKELFTMAKVAKTLETGPPIESTVLDDLYPESARTPYDSPVIPLSEITSTVKVVPVVSRQGEPVPITADTLAINYIEPLPVYVESGISPVDINNLKLMGRGQKESWSQRKTLQARQTVKVTLEALASQAVFNGKIAHPLLQQGGTYATYNVGFGADILSTAVAAADKWDHAEATLLKVFQQLEAFCTTLNRAGFPGKKKHYAGVTAFAQLMALADAKDKPKVPVTITAGEISVGGHVIKKMDEVYTNPATGAEVEKVPAKELRTVSQGYTSFYYAALDSFKAGLKAMPLFMDVVEVSRPERLVITGQSKPLPVSAPKSVHKAIVIT